MDQESDYKTVGRFTLIGFKPVEDDVVAVVDFQHRDGIDKGFPKIGYESAEMDLGSTHLALLVDTLPKGKEQAYLSSILDAQWALSNLQLGLNHVFDTVSSGKWPSDELERSRNKHWHTIQQALQPLLKDDVAAKFAPPTLDA